jgi:glycosyltransferase involved in cell wall biosynthesis
VADPDYGKLVSAAIASRRLESSVTLVGERTDVRDILPEVDVCVLSSSSEGLPLALLEYGLAARAVVVTDIGQCGDVVDGGNAGLLVPPGRPRELATAIVSLLESNDRRRSLGNRLYLRVLSDFSAEAAADRISQLYARILG